MKKNVGSTDRIIRMVLAIAIGYFSYSTSFETAWLQAVLYVIATLMLLTSILGTCPVYSLFKINTDEVKNSASI